MFVLPVHGSHQYVVNDVVANGAKISEQIAEACGRGRRLWEMRRRTCRAIIEAHFNVTAARRKR